MLGKNTASRFQCLENFPYPTCRSWVLRGAGDAAGSLRSVKIGVRGGLCACYGAARENFSFGPVLVCGRARRGVWCWRAVARRQHAVRPSKFRQRWLRRRVQYGLRVQRWSPEQIAGYLQVAYPPTNRSGGSRTKRSINFWWRRRGRAGITGVMCDAWVGGAATVNAARTSVFATRGVLTNAPRSWRPNAGWATGKLTACAGHSRATPGWPSLQNAKPSMWWWRKQRIARRPPLTVRASGLSAAKPNHPCAPSRPITAGSLVSTRRCAPPRLSGVLCPSASCVGAWLGRTDQRIAPRIFPEGARSHGGVLP